MKAEHRHELKTNALADMMGRALQSLKTGPSRHSLFLLGLVVVGVAVALGGYLLWKDHQEAGSKLWVTVDDAQRKLDSAANGDEVLAALKDFKETADKNAGTPQARVLRFDRARTLMRQGMERLCSPQDREKAVADLKEARDIYVKLAADTDNEPVLIQEALMGVAKIDESTGNLDEALKGYKKLASTYAGSVLGKSADERAKYLDNPDNRKLVQELYEKLDKEVATVLPPLSSTPDKK